MASYLAAIAPFLLRGRKGITLGWFKMPQTIGFVVNTVACSFMMVFIVIFCFPFVMPVNAENMNYASLITGGLTIFVAIWWLVIRKEYVGPQDLVEMEGKATEMTVAEYRASISA